MRVSYYPGCSLEATAKDYTESIMALMPKLEVELVELPDWNCCGATAAHSLDHRAALNLGVRNLVIAAEQPQPLVVPCALCFSRLKFAQQEALKETDLLLPELAAKADQVAKVEVVELNRFLTSPAMLERIGQAGLNPLSGIKPVCYYGCQGQRPPGVTQSPDYEHPVAMEQLLAALGAEVRDWDFGTDCCGASHTIARPDLVYALSGRLFEQALEAGANCIATGCQMCQANLDMQEAAIAAKLGRELYVPVFYFTELIAMALGDQDYRRWLGRHFVNPGQLLKNAAFPETVREAL